MNLQKWEMLLAESAPDSQCAFGHMANETYGGRNAVEIETGIFLYGLVRRFLPRVILETGTHMGFASACLALALEDKAKDFPLLKTSRVLTIDCGEYEQSAALREKLGLQEWIVPILADSSTYQYDYPRPIDMLFLDSDHGEEFVLKEFMNFFPHLSRERAVVLFHDTVIDPREREAIARIFSEEKILREKYRGISYFPFRNLRGLDLILFSNEQFQEPYGRNLAGHFSSPKRL